MGSVWKKPSAVRSPVRNSRSRSSTSLVMSVAPSASVRATTIVGTSMHIGREAGGGERADVLLGRDQHLATHVAALLLRRQLVLPVHPGGTRFDHRLHQLERVERSAEAGLGVGDDRAPSSRGSGRRRSRTTRSGQRGATRC